MISLGKDRASGTVTRHGSTDNRNKNTGLSYLQIPDPRVLIQQEYDAETPSQKGKHKGFFNEGDISSSSMYTGYQETAAVTWVNKGSTFPVVRRHKIHDGVTFQQSQDYEEGGFNVLRSEQLLATPSAGSSKARFSVEPKQVHESIEHHEHDAEKHELPTHRRHLGTMEYETRNPVPFASVPINTDVNASSVGILMPNARGVGNENVHNAGIGQRHLL